MPYQLTGAQRRSAQPIVAGLPRFMISGRNYGQQQNHQLMLDYLTEYIVWQDMPGETLSGQQTCFVFM